MNSANNVIKFPDAQTAGSFSQPGKIDEKMSSGDYSEKIAKSLQFKGSAMTCTAPSVVTQENASSHALEKTKKSVAVVPSSSAKVDSAFKAHCETMTATQLRVTYPGEYNSWKNGKGRCKAKGWDWATPWSDFRVFLLAMGPKPSPDCTLDRIDNEVPGYGPDLCRWATPTVQNNNKSNNVKIVIPVTGETFTPQKLAKLHGVQVQTVYKWHANFYSPLEMVAGKKSKPLRDLWVALVELPVTPKGKKAPARPIQMPPFKLENFLPPNFEPQPWTSEDMDYYQETGKLRDSRCDQVRAEYDAVADWAKRYNAGEDVPPQPPHGQFVRFRAPSETASKKWASKHSHSAADYSNAFDPADEIGPEHEDD